MTIPITIPQGGNVPNYGYPGGPSEGLLYSAMDLGRAIRSAGREMEKLMKQVAEEDAYEEEFRADQARVKLAEQTEDWYNQLGSQSFKDANGIPNGTKIQQAFDDFRRTTSAQLSASIPKSQQKQWQLDEAQHWLRTQQRVLAYRGNLTDTYIAEIMPRQVQSQARGAEDYGQLEGIVNSKMKTMRRLQGRPLEPKQEEDLWGPAEWAWVSAGAYEGTEEFEKRLSQTQHLEDKEIARLTASEEAFRESKDKEADKAHAKQIELTQREVNYGVATGAITDVMLVDNLYHDGFIDEICWRTNRKKIITGEPPTKEEIWIAVEGMESAFQAVQEGSKPPSYVAEQRKKYEPFLTDTQIKAYAAKSVTGPQTMQDTYLSDARKRALSRLGYLAEQDLSDTDAALMGEFTLEFNKRWENRFTADQTIDPVKAQTLLVEMLDWLEQKQPRGAGSQAEKNNAPAETQKAKGMPYRFPYERDAFWSGGTATATAPRAELDTILTDADLPEPIRKLIQQARAVGISDADILGSDDLQPYLKGGG